MKFLTHDGLLYFWKKVKNYIDTGLNAKASSVHSHTKSQITDFPASLPANGGDSDTVDGKHASDFIQYNGTHAIIPKQGGNEGGEILLEHADTTTLSGTGINIDVCEDRIRIFENSGIARGFYLDIKEGLQGANSNLRNADTVDGYHVDFGTKNTYGLRPIAMDTFDLVAGTTSMYPGHIYIMYE